MTFYPDEWPVPEGMRTQDLVLRVLTPEVVELDYDALMESRVRLRVWSDGDWPTDDFTLAGNLTDLEEHEREFHAREAFAYTVLSADESRCEGCVYINPLARWMANRAVSDAGSSFTAGEHDAFVSFWVRDSALARGLDRELVAGLLDWFATEWRFPNVYFFANDRLTHDHQVLAGAGCSYVATLESTDSPGLGWQLWGLPG